MAVAPLQLVLVGILAAGLGLLAYALVSLGALLHLRRRDRTDGGPVEPGVLAVEGTASAAGGRDPVQSPVTGTDALVYEYAIQHRVGAAATPDWRTVAGGQAGAAFDLAVDGDRVRVDPSSASLGLPVAEEVPFEADPDALDGAEDLPLAAVRVAQDGETLVFGDVQLVPGDRYRVVERRIEPGDVVRVAGVATRAGSALDDARGGPVTFREFRSSLRQFVGVPYVVGDADGGAETRLRNRAIVGVLFGLPLAMLGFVYLYVQAG